MQHKNTPALVKNRLRQKKMSQMLNEDIFMWKKKRRAPLKRFSGKIGG